MPSLKQVISTFLDNQSVFSTPLIRRLEVNQNINETVSVPADGAYIALIPTLGGSAERRSVLIAPDQILEVYADTTGLKASDGVNAAPLIKLFQIEAGGIWTLMDITALDKLLFRNTGLETAEIQVVVGGN